MIILLVCFSLSPLIDSHSTLKSGDSMNQTIVSDYNNNSSVDLSNYSWNNYWNANKAFTYDWQDPEGFILIGYEDPNSNSVKLRVLFNNNSESSISFVALSSVEYIMTSLFIDSSGNILLSKRTSDSTCSYRYGEITLDSTLSVISNISTSGSGDCGSSQSRRSVNNVDIIQQRWETSGWPATGQRGSSFSIGNYSVSSIIPSHQSSTPAYYPWGNVLVINETLAFYKLGHLFAVNPHTGAVLWQEDWVDKHPIQYFEEENVVITEDAKFYANNGTQDNTIIIPFNNSDVTSDYTNIVSDPNSQFYVYTTASSSQVNGTLLVNKNNNQTAIYLNGTLIGPLENQKSYIHLDGAAGLQRIVTFDRDNDGVISYPFQIPGDSCEFTINYTQDFDLDGCDDLSEDDDDDNDGILDVNDTCLELPGGIDYDSDGCSNENDDDDDNDNVNDNHDNCPLGVLNWSINGTDFDLDGCEDNMEDNDDDSDLIPDYLDLCPLSINVFISNNSTDFDRDGCNDNTEDDFPNDGNASLDSDGDGLADFVSEFSCCTIQTEGFDDGEITDNSPLQIDTGDFWSVQFVDGFLGGNAAVLNTSDVAPLWIQSDNQDAWFTFTISVGCTECSFSFETKYFGENQANQANNHIDLHLFDEDNNTWNHITQIGDSSNNNWMIIHQNLYSEGNHTFRITNYDNDGLTGDTNWAIDRFVIPGSTLRENNSSLLLTPDGTYQDFDDDNDNWLDQNELECNTNPLNSSDFPIDFDGDFICDLIDEDLDNDGFVNNQDAFPFDSSEWNDFDNDGIGDNLDTDDDNDGVDDLSDYWPLDNCASTNSDGDDFPDSIFFTSCTHFIEDLDDDNDGLYDQDDFCSPGEIGWLSGAVTDLDSDGCRDDGEDTDDDNDGIQDMNDLCYRGFVGWTSTPSLDWDSDGCHDINEDSDDDNDGVNDNNDNCQYTSDNISVDSSGCPLDSDNDGVPDYLDAFPNDPNESSDSDGDGVGDNSDAFPNDSSESLDSDGDGVGDNSDAFPDDPNESSDSDQDGVGDNSDAFPDDPNESSDSDQDGVGDNSDSCQETSFGVMVNSDGCVIEGASSSENIVLEELLIPVLLTINLLVISFFIVIIRNRKRN